jgi:hypothetical protein
VLDAVFSIRSDLRTYRTAGGNIKTLCRQQIEVIQNHEKEHVRSMGKGEARNRKYKEVKLGGGQGYNRSSD